MQFALRRRRQLTCYDVELCFIAILQPQSEPRTRKARSTSSNLCNSRVLRDFCHPSRSVLASPMARHNRHQEVGGLAACKTLGIEASSLLKRVRLEAFAALVIEIYATYHRSSHAAAPTATAAPLGPASSSCSSELQPWVTHNVGVTVCEVWKVAACVRGSVT